jgi:hypothetical protein
MIITTEKEHCIFLNKEAQNLAPGSPALCTSGVTFTHSSYLKSWGYNFIGQMHPLGLAKPLKVSFLAQALVHEEGNYVKSGRWGKT